MRTLSKTRVFFFPLLAGLLGCTSLSPVRNPAAAENWVVSWARSPMSPAAKSNFEDQTLRLIVHGGLGGRHFRLHLSNAYGLRPVEFGAVSIATCDASGRLKAGSVKSVTFAGRSRATLEARSSLVSDPIRLEVPDNSDLCISLYLPSKTSVETVHNFTAQDSFVSMPGDHSFDDVFKNAQKMSSWPYLTSVEVQSDAAETVAILGDSISDGLGSGVNANHRWPDFLAERLYARAPGRWAVANCGISGNRLLHDGPDAQNPFSFGAAALSRLERDVLSLSRLKRLIVLIGINDVILPRDLHAPDAVGADDIVSALIEIAQKARAQNVKVYIGTLLPNDGCRRCSPEKTQMRLAVNHWIRTNEFFDGIIDFERAVADPDNPARLLPLYDSGDHLHPSDAGYKAMAEAVDLSLFDLP